MGHSAGHDIDPTFYRSPADAISAPPEQLAYVVAFDRAAQLPDALAVLDADPASAGYGQVVGWADLPTRGDELHHFGWNACSSAFAHAGHHTDGSAAAPLPAAARAAVLQHPRLRHPPRPAAAHAGQDDQRGRAGKERGILAPAHPALRPGRDLRVLPRRRERRRRPRRHRPARPRHLRRAARLGDRPRTAVPGLRRLVAPEPEHADHQRVGHPVDDRGRGQPGAAAQPQVRARAALLGPGRGQAPADGRPGRAVPDGPGAAPVARPRADLGLRRRGGQHRRPVRLGVAVEPPGRDLARRQGDHHPGRTRRRGRAAPGAQAVRRGAAAGHRHQPRRSTTSSFTSPAGAPASSSSTTSATRPTPARSARSGSAASPAGSRTPRRRASRWPAARRWSRSAGTASGST